MPNYSIGQFILLLIFDADQAASIVGDLIESRVRPLRFWTAIGSHLLHALTPKVFGMALAGFLAQFVIIETLALALVHSSVFYTFSFSQRADGLWFPPV